MKTPLHLPSSDILQNVNDRFETGATALEFLPVGESSWIYIASDEAGKKSVIKVQEQLNPATSEVLELLNQQKFEWMPQLATSVDGQIWEKVDDLYFSSQQYIGSLSLNHAGSEPDETYLHTLGTMLKDLHSIQIDDDQLPHVERERFDSPLIGQARIAVEAIASQARPNEAVQAVQQCFEAQKEYLNQFFVNVERYGAALSNLPNNFTLTHGDVHFGNIIEPSEGRLYLVDWDEASIALPEMDLKYFSDEQLAVISQGYGQDLSKNRLQIQYYRNLQMVRALWFWPNKLLETPEGEQGPVSKTIVEIFSSSPYFLRALTEVEGFAS